MNKKQITCIIILVFIFISLLGGVFFINNLNPKFSPKTDDNNISSSTKDYFKKTTVRTTINENGEVVTLPPETTEAPTEGTTQNGETTTEGQTSGNTTTSKKSTTTTKKTTTTQAIPSKISCSNRQIVSLSREEVLAKIGHPYNSNTCIKWNGFIKGSKDTFDGSIPTEWLADPIYLSMAMPAEVKSEYMIGANRDNAHDMGITNDRLRKMQVAIGAIYLTKDATLPDTFTINYGKIKLFGYSKSKNKWVVIDSQPHPKMVMQYQLPWTAHLPTTDFTSKFIDHGSYVSINYTKGDIDNTHIMHLWGQITSYDKSDYLYYASAYEVWTSTPAAVGGLTATSGIDTKEKSGGDALQLYSSYGMKVTTSKKVLWGHTIPMNEYDYYRDSVQLQNLFNSN